MKILLINNFLGTAFTELGHEVLALHPKGGVICLQKLLEDKNFCPELILQQETLSARVLIQDLPRFQCPKIFWSIDTHLNTFWHQYYGRLFDLVLSTQQDWLPTLKYLGLPQIGWLPWYGSPQTWRPWDQRKNELGFVGRITSHRPVREAFIRYLQANYNLNLQQSLDKAGMMDLYADSKIVPNESIAGEVNFRTFEATSAGCMLIAQDCGQQLGELFDIGKEIFVFSHVLELKSILNFCLKNEIQIKQMGLLARQRVLAQHLPLHRAQHILELHKNLTSQAQTGINAQIAWHLTLLTLWQADRLHSSVQHFAKFFFALPTTPEVLTALIHISCNSDWEPKKESLLQNLLAPVLNNKQYEHELIVNLAGTFAALQVGWLSMAKHFTYRFLKNKNSPNIKKPIQTPVQLCLVWARELFKIDLNSRPGFIFSPKKHLPQSAFECLVLAYEYDKQDQQLLAMLDSLICRKAGFDPLRLQLLSFLSLRQRNNWRLGLELGMTNLRMFRLNQGLEELLLASDQAASCGQSSLFIKKLQSLDNKGLIQKALR